MPKERIHKCSNSGFMDLLVQWGRDEISPKMGDAQPRVRLMAAPSELGQPGAFYFYPDLTDEEKLAEPDRIGAHGEGVGPVDMWLDRPTINRMIRVLRRARDQAYGRDE